MPMATLNTYQNAVVDRYKAADGTTDYEKAWSYLDRIMGRELGKAGGLLTFNAVLIAVAVAMGPWWTVICPVVASLVLLLLLGVARGMGQAAARLPFNAVLIGVAVAMGRGWTVICPVVASLVLLLLLGVARGTPSEIKTDRKSTRLNSSHIPLS